MVQDGIGVAASGRGSESASLATERNHPAWRGMYLLMLANQALVLGVYMLAR